MPRVFVQTVVFGSSRPASACRRHVAGHGRRFRSLPTARSAMLASRRLADTERKVFLVHLMVLVGTVIGFRLHAGFVHAVAGLVLLGFAFCWPAANIGLGIREAESDRCWAQGLAQSSVFG